MRTGVWLNDCWSSGESVREQLAILHRRLLAIVREDDVCRRLMTILGVGPVVALTYRVTVDVPARFRNSKAVGGVFGLSCSKYQSGEINRTGAISKCGDEMMRMMLYEAAQVMLTRTNILGLTTRLKLPAVYEQREVVAAGGLMSYGPNVRRCSTSRHLYRPSSQRAKSPPICRFWNPQNSI